MSLLSRLFEQRALTMQTVFSRDLDLLPRRNESGVAINQANALSDSAIWAAVTLLAGDIMSLPCAAYRSAGDVRAKLPAQPAWLDRPDPMDPNISWPDHVGSAAISLLLDGSTFVLAEPDVIRPERLEVLNPTQIVVRRKGRGRTYDMLSGDVGLSPLNLIHAELFRRPGDVRGLSPIDEHAESIGLSRAAEKYSARFFGSGATMAGIIKTPPGVAITNDDRKQMRAEFDKTHGGWKKSYALGILEGGAEWIQTSANPKDSQLVELRAYQVEEAARIYGIPPHMVGSQQPGAVAYASVEQRSIDYVTHTLARYLAPLEAAYSRLVPGDSRLSVPGSNTYIKFNVTGLLRGDAAARAAFYKSMWEIGALNPDDVRRFEDQPPIEQGKGSQYFYPINYAPLPTPGAADVQPAPTPLHAVGTAA